MLASGFIAFSGCSKLGNNNSTDKVRIGEIWLFNADNKNEHTIYIKLLNREEPFLNEQYTLSPKKGDVAGSEKIQQQLPNSPGQFSIVSWTESHPENKSEVSIYKETEANCVTVDISISDDRNYPAIFINDNCK